MRRFFNWFATSTSTAAGQPITFATALAIIIIWAVTGPMFHYSDTWQLIINTGTTIVTFLMVFLIQNTQNRDSKALHLKLDELIRSAHGARTSSPTPRRGCARTLGIAPRSCKARWTAKRRPFAQVRAVVGAHS